MFPVPAAYSSTTTVSTPLSASSKCSCREPGCPGYKRTTAKRAAASLSKLVIVSRSGPERERNCWLKKPSDVNNGFAMFQFTKPPASLFINFKLSAERTFPPYTTYTPFFLLRAVCTASSRFLRGSSLSSGSATLAVITTGTSAAENSQKSNAAVYGSVSVPYVTTMPFAVPDSMRSWIAATRCAQSAGSASSLNIVRTGKICTGYSSPVLPSNVLIVSASPAATVPSSSLRAVIVPPIVSTYTTLILSSFLMSDFTFCGTAQPSVAFITQPVRYSSGAMSPF